MKYVSPFPMPIESDPARSFRNLVETLMIAQTTPYMGKQAPLVDDRAAGAAIRDFVNQVHHQVRRSLVREHEHTSGWRRADRLISGKESIILERSRHQTSYPPIHNPHYLMARYGVAMNEALQMGRWTVSTFAIWAETVELVQRFPRFSSSSSLSHEISVITRRDPVNRPMHGYMKYLG